MQISTLDDVLNKITNTDTTMYSDADKHSDLTLAALFLNVEYLKAKMGLNFMGNTTTANLVASTAITNRFYAFPTNFLKLTRIDIMPDGSNWVRCKWIDPGQIGDALGSETDVINKFDNSEPFWTIVGNKIVILSGTLTAVTNGIRYWFSEGIVGRNASGTALTAFSADTDVPELPNPYQIGLVYYAAKLYFQQYGMTDRISEMDTEIEKIISRMQQFPQTDESLIMGSASSLENYE